jgi:hypothetical protein
MNEIKKAMAKVNKEQQFRSKIHDGTNFYNSSIKLLVGWRCGNTFNVRYEIVELDHILLLIKHLNLLH